MDFEAWDLHLFADFVVERLFFQRFRSGRQIHISCVYNVLFLCVQVGSAVCSCLSSKHDARRRPHEIQAAAFRSLSTQVTESSVKLIEVDIFYNLGTGAAQKKSGFGGMGGTFSAFLLLVF